MATQKKIEKMRLSKSQQFLFSRDNSRRWGVKGCYNGTMQNRFLRLDIFSFVFHTVPWRLVLVKVSIVFDKTQARAEYQPSRLHMKEKWKNVQSQESFLHCPNNVGDTLFCLFYDGSSFKMLRCRNSTVELWIRWLIRRVGDLFNLKNQSPESRIGHQYLKVVINTNRLQYSSPTSL